MKLETIIISGAVTNRCFAKNLGLIYYDDTLKASVKVNQLLIKSDV